MKILKISSVSNVITNSSTEIFAIADRKIIDEITKEHPLGSLFSRNCDFIQNQEDLKAYLKRIFPYSSELYALNNCPLIKYNPLVSDIMDDLKEIYTTDEIIDFFSKCYEPLIGCTLIELDVDDVFSNIIQDKLEKYNFDSKKYMWS